MTLRLPRTLLAWCYFWLLLAPIWSAQPGPLRLGIEGPVRILADGLQPDRAIRAHKAEIQARLEVRPGAAGSADGGSKSIAPAGAPPGTEFVFTSASLPEAAAPLTGFPAHRTRHPRAPPA